MAMNLANPTLRTGHGVGRRPAEALRDPRNWTTRPTVGTERDAGFGMDRWMDPFAGFERMFTEWPRMLGAEADAAFAYNLIRQGDWYRIEMAVPGFSEDEISVELKGDTLEIYGERENRVSSGDVHDSDGRVTHADRDDKSGDADADPQIEYIHQGLNTGSFRRSFSLDDNLEVERAVMDHGILRIDLRQLAPDSGQTRKIPVETEA